MSVLLAALIPSFLLSIAASVSIFLFYLERRKQPRSSLNWLLACVGILLFPSIMLSLFFGGDNNWFKWVIYSISQLLIGVGFFRLYRSELKSGKLSEGIILQDSSSLENITQFDSVTKLPNQRQFEAKFKLTFQKNIKEHKAMSLLSVGLDDYKAIVITYDQAGADTAIRHIARILENSIRDFDLLAHTSQEGFHLLLEDTESQEAALIAERIRAKIENNPANWKDQQIHLKCSIGVIIIAENATMPNSTVALIKASDTALLLARQKGGNRVILSAV